MILNAKCILFCSVFVTSLRRVTISSPYIGARCRSTLPVDGKEDEHVAGHRKHFQIVLIIYKHGSSKWPLLSPFEYDLAVKIRRCKKCKKLQYFCTASEGKCQGLRATPGEKNKRQRKHQAEYSKNHYVYSLVA